MPNDNLPTANAPAPPKSRGRMVLLAVMVLAAGLGVWQSWDVWFKHDPTRPAVLAELVHPGAAAGYNVLLITLDTTRPDHLGCYGYTKIKTPAIDSLLEHGVRFDDAVASAPLTLPSHATMMTGLYPPRLGVRDNGSYRLAAEHRTMAEVLKETGYDTAAFVSAFVLDKRFGLDQGFDVYDFAVSDQGRRGPESMLNERRADAVTTSAIDWLEQRARRGAKDPFFAWVHYYDPHHPYTSPLAELGAFRAESAYDAEIAFVDLHLKRLLNTVDRLDLGDRTLIVLASDHGESLNEHQEITHGVFIYEVTIRAALLLSCPTLFDRPYRADDRVVGLVDVLPTTLDLLGMPPPSAGDGQSLLQAHADPERPIYIESYHPREQLGCSELVGLRRHTDKYILAPTAEYYDLRKDPKETRNRYDAGLARLTSLKEQLADLLQRWRQTGSDRGGAKVMSPEEEARLRSLGYAGTTAITTARSWPDPKDQIEFINQTQQVNELATSGRYDEALALAQQVAAKCEGYAYPVLLLAQLYEKTDRLQEACGVLQAYAEHYPSADILMHLAKDHFALRQYDRMEESLQAAEVLDPRRGSVPELRGDRLFAAERYAEAVRQYEKAIEIDGIRLGLEVRDKLVAARARLDDLNHKGN